MKKPLLRTEAAKQNKRLGGLRKLDVGCNLVLVLLRNPYPFQNISTVDDCAVIALHPWILRGKSHKSSQNGTDMDTKPTSRCRHLVQKIPNLVINQRSKNLVLFQNRFTRIRIKLPIKMLEVTQFPLGHPCDHESFQVKFVSSLVRPVVVVTHNKVIDQTGKHEFVAEIALILF